MHIFMYVQHEFVEVNSLLLNDGHILEEKIHGKSFAGTYLFRMM